MKDYIITYDIFNPKRAYKIRKLIYSYAFSGQKSLLELILNRRDLKDILKLLKPLLEDNDAINIIEIEKNPMLFGKAKNLKYDNGVIII